MSLVIGILQSANHRRGRTDELCELLLREACALAKLVDLARNRVVGLGLGQFGDSLWTPLVVATMNDFNRVGRGLWLTVFPHVFRSRSGHRLTTPRKCRASEPARIFACSNARGE